MTKLTDDELLAWLDGGPIQNAKANKLYCEAIAARFRELIALQEWQPIETAPRDGRWILVTWLGEPNRCEAMRCNENGDWQWWEGDCSKTPPTHWRPLPDPPKDG